jgi:hypothetical protein
VVALDLRARQRPHGQPLAPDRLAFLADPFALARGKGCQEIVEAGVTVIVPVILLAQPQQPAVLAEALPVGLAAEGGMDRADAVVAGDLGQHVDHGVAHAVFERPGAREQARSRHRREGHGGLELGIIAAAGPLEGLRPAMVEDIFSLAVAFHVKRDGALQGAVVGFGQEILRLPAGAPADRLGILQRLQEAVAEERVAGRARRQRAGVPLLGLDCGKRFDDPQADGRRVIRHGSSIARIVPGIAPGIGRRILLGRSAAMRELAEIKKVRQTKVAGPVITYAFPPPKGGGVRSGFTPML